MRLASLHGLTKRWMWTEEDLSVQALANYLAPTLGSLAFVLRCAG